MNQRGNVRGGRRGEATRPGAAGDPLIPKHGGYRKLKSFQVAQLIYDVTVRFCDLYIERRSRTRDQMVQAARSGTQNIAEGSVASGTSKKMELKLTQVARASLEELRLDYEDFLRQRELPKLEPNHPALVRFKASRPRTLDEVRAWVAEERRRAIQADKSDTDEHGRSRTRAGATTSGEGPGGASVSVHEGPCGPLPSACLVANAALSLLNLACHLLDRQVERLARDFEREGGFTERLYRHRKRAQRRSRP
ncbi:four helix bundle suffix domain-containing protein [Deferrisoma camini]|uniref:four helix bundle suffix domain-containing protein n=1 Tax=Deferrisoma camini TaxID=1035120 RepID=UPI00046D4C9F|nr:four helix bundle suffix domain-containing protein [Deferrisoma camini]